MKDPRFDNRTEAEFRGTMKHATTIEGYLFRRWEPVAHLNSPIRVLSSRPNGCDNTGEFLPRGTNTSGADFKACLSTPAGVLEDLPLEVKLVPKHGFLTLKEHDLAAYVREGAAILFVCPVLPSADLRQCNGLSLPDRIALLDATRLEWGIMWPDSVRRVSRMEMSPQKRMGFKSGVCIERDKYASLFKLYRLAKPGVA